MRFHACEFLVNIVRWFFSDRRIGGMETPAGRSSTGARPLIRTCANIKSRTAPDVRCSLSATHGEFCSRHWKRPRRYIQPTLLRKYEEGVLGQPEREAVRTLARFWRSKCGWLRTHSQGIGRAILEKSQNETELYTFDPIAMIPALYYISFVDNHRLLWSFDVRSLISIMAQGRLKENPYTREPFPDRLLERLRRRIRWLRDRRFSLVHPQGTDLTAEQLWNQRILDVCMTMDRFGYTVSCDWFHSMTAEGHAKFYTTLYVLWFYRLGLTAEQRDAIVPGHATASRRLFKFTLDELRFTPHTKGWWERANLSLIEALVSRSPDREQQKLGVMYCVMGFVAVHDEAAEVFPWFVHALD